MSQIVLLNLTNVRESSRFSVDRNYVLAHSVQNLVLLAKHYSLDCLLCSFFLLSFAFFDRL